MCLRGKEGYEVCGLPHFHTIMLTLLQQCSACCELVQSILMPQSWVGSPLGHCLHVGAWRITLGERKCDHGWFAVHTHVSRHVPRIYQDDVPDSAGDAPNNTAPVFIIQVHVEHSPDVAAIGQVMLVAIE
jgi:hypothetical protein